MIVATAGHIDHGKTLLVKALTGIDTDRLPEEKRRGISIDLGYAYHPLADGEILGFVDVPGHEKFIHNMLAGVTGIDCALLVVAADDGPMPQTIEHLTILDLLGLENGVVALTKIDRVDADRVHEVAETVQSLLDATGLAGAPVLPVSGITGEGVDAVREHLVAAARRGRAEAAKGYFRLAIDRTFTIKGAGLVVTGTIFSGAVHPDDRLVISPRGMMVRVRGVHAQNREAKEAHPGQRSALNIAGQGLSKDLIHRGDWVVAEPIHAPTARIDGRIKLLPSEERPLKHWTPVHLHLGAADVTARLAILEGRAIEPGASALVQIVLDTPIGALSGDRFILRDQSAWRTIGGGVVIDPFPPRRGRSRPQRLATLAAMERDDRAEALAGMLEQSPAGLDLDRLARSWNLMPGEAGALWAKALSAGAPMVVLGAGAAGTGLSQARWQTLRQAILAALADWHRSSPDQIGASENALRLALSEPVPPNLFKAIVSDLAREGELMASGRLLRLPQHQTAMAPKDAALWERLKPILDQGGWRPPAVHKIAETLGIAPAALTSFLRRASAQGLVKGVAENRFLLPGAVGELGRIVEELAGAAEDGQLTVAAFRDRTGIGRNLAIEVLEFFDQAGLTRRVDQARIVLRPASEVFGRAAP